MGGLYGYDSDEFDNNDRICDYIKIRDIRFYVRAIIPSLLLTLAHVGGL